MNRPTRQHTHLEEKLAAKASRRTANASGAEKKPRPVGAKEKRWKKSAEAYRAIAAGGEPTS